MEIIIELFVQVLGEIVLTAVPELIVGPMAHLLEKPRDRNPFIAGFGYFFLGLIFGGLSLLLFRASFIVNPTLRLVNLFLSPVLIGAAMARLGAHRQKQGKELVFLGSFAHSAIFAFGLAMIRFAYARH